MSKAKRVVGATTLLVTLLSMMIPAFGQTRIEGKKRKGKASSAATITRSVTESTTGAKPASAVPAATVPLLLLRSRNRSGSVVAAVNRTSASSNVATRQTSTPIWDTQRIAAGLTGETTGSAATTLSGPTAPASSTSSATTTSSSSFKLNPPSAPNRIN
jgi:hypothetical protein